MKGSYSVFRSSDCNRPLDHESRIEKRYRLPVGYFAAKLPHTERAGSGHTKLGEMSPSERCRMAWHRPIDPARGRSRNELRQ